MENKTKKSENDKIYNNYTFKDSCLMFILALFLPYLVYFIFIMLVNIFAQNTPFANEVLNGVVGNYVSAFICQISLLIGVYYIAKKRKAKFLQISKKSFKLDYLNVLLCVIIGIVALFGFNWLSDMLTHVLGLIGYKTSGSTLLNYGVTNFGILLVCILFLAVLPAICEEFCMRGVILKGCNKKGKNFAIIISALMFMVIHLSVEQSFYQFILGLVLATIVYYSGNILYSIILHFINNSLVLVLNYVSSTSLTPQKFVTFWDYFLPILTALFTCFIIFVLIKLFIKRNKKLGTKNLFEQIEISHQESAVSKKTDANLKDAANRDLPPVKLEVLSEKTFFIISLSLGIFMWFINVISGFLL